jgi:hypothetical protein
MSGGASGGIVLGAEGADRIVEASPHGFAVWRQRAIELNRPRFRSPEMAGFEVSTNGRFCPVHRGRIEESKALRVELQEKTAERQAAEQPADEIVLKTHLKS